MYVAAVYFKYTVEPGFKEPGFSPKPGFSPLFSDDGIFTT